jgi:Protein of unknown function (DUF3047)
MKAHWRAWSLASAFVAAALGGCATISQEPTASPVGAGPTVSQPTAPAAERGAAKWQHLLFPGKTPTAFGYAREDGRDAVVATASSSASMLRRPVRIEPHELGSIVFSWKVPQLINGADMALRDTDDSPVRVVLVFEGDRSRFSSRDAMLSELMRTLTGEQMPYATLMYVWCNRRQPGTLITNPRTDRIRKLVVESGSANLDQWLDYRRDVRADFERAFGEPPGALVGVGIMSDTDNTRSTARAWYGPVQLEAAHTRAAR